jgi:hypothetical protein
MVNGKNIIDVNIYEIIKKVGRDLIPAQRLKILESLWYQRALPIVNKWQTTKEISNGVNMPVSSTKFTLEDMMVLRIVERDIENEGQEKSPYLWKLTDQIFDWMTRSEVFGESA